MNAALAFLLRKIYDAALAPAHLANLRASGLTDKTILGHYIRSVPPAMIRPLLGLDSPRIISAALFPFRSPAGGFMDHVSMKVFPPLADGEVKYLQPRGAPPRLYFTIPGLQALDDDRALWCVEGVKKALAVAQLGLPTIGIAGVEGWHRSGSRDLIPDFDAIRLDGRIVELLPDGDVHTNPLVRQGVERLALALRRRGARPRLVLLPRELSTHE